MKFTALLLTSLSSIASANVVSLDDSNYTKVTSDRSLVFVKFFAPW